MRTPLVSALIAGAALVAIADAKSSCPKNLRAVIESEIAGADFRDCEAKSSAVGGPDYVAEVDTREDVVAEIDFAPDGRVARVERQMAVDELPPLVYAAFRTEYPDVDMEWAEEVRSPAGFSYSVGFLRKGRFHEAEFDQDGEFMTEGRSEPVRVAELDEGG